MKSVMSKDFSRVATTDISHSTFDRGHGLKTAFNAGDLVPVELQEVVPSDIVEFDGKFLARLAPVVTPVFDNVFLDLHAFFVPSRILYNNFTKLMGEQKNPRDSIDYLIPQALVPCGEEMVGSLADYFGLPVQQGDSATAKMSVSAIPFRAYQKIWDDWYRDENLQDSVIQSTSELGDVTIDATVEADKKWFALRKRGKRHDYFTSGLPWPQKGDSVNLPLGEFAPVVSRSGSEGSADKTAGAPLTWTNAVDGSVVVGDQNINGHQVFSLQGNNADTFVKYLNGSYVEDVGVMRVKPRNLWADLSTATAATVNSLRMAFQVQRCLELSARGGTRYCEIIRSAFRTVCPDARLQRSEFLGSSSIRINFSPVAQTSATTDISPQGNLAATAHAYGGLKFKRAFSEHGYILILASVRCDLNYQQGIDRLWSRKSRWDFYWPTLAHLGEQEIRNKEIYYSGDNTKDEGVFAYQERYAELRYNPSRITGKMRSGVSGSLDVWHLAQHFESLPVLSPEFIEEDPPLDRVLAVTEGEPQVLMDAFLGQKWTRPLPTYSIPGLIDHF